jgi:hypothetical protein
MTGGNMKGTFHLRCSQAAALLLPEKERQKVITEAVKRAERLAPNADDTAIFNIDDLKLKIVVQFARREVSIMTFEEAKKAGLPDKPTLHTDN